MAGVALTLNGLLDVGHFCVDLLQVVGRLLGSLFCADELIGQVDLGQVLQLALNFLELEVGRFLGSQLLHRRRDLVVEQLERPKAGLLKSFEEDNIPCQSCIRHCYGIKRGKCSWWVSHLIHNGDGLVARRCGLTTEGPKITFATLFKRTWHSKILKCFGTLEKRKEDGNNLRY